ncbi:TlpA family protein disulfide reductase [Pyxidicoccus fallax]|uniref:TlpA family protein disulfide reductase n=1 Tax=Pyxidicoccus fallax TaxID=394095 RepID=A0A848LCS8_9BACT|nr:TlpA disulfide reductase family protein [Pyxidicoccus fallax]NMO14615.1 TlpA family protein disulfide reductase [Pyxidicoccus fallax]NPC77379.1 TlpA family protein disulfide reductase [Pyxidicoccus fallax]
MKSDALILTWRVLTLCLLAMTWACRSEPPPSYIRLAGPAPVLADVPGSRALLVVFWASWCPPCVEETPQLRALAESPPEGLQVVVFSHDADARAVESFFKGPPPPDFHLRVDVGKKVARSYGVEQLPTSILVVDGRLVARFPGPRDWDSKAMRRLLERLTREPADRAAGPAD